MSMVEQMMSELNAIVGNEEMIAMTRDINENLIKGLREDAHPMAPLMIGNLLLQQEMAEVTVLLTKQGTSMEAISRVALDADRQKLAALKALLTGDHKSHEQKLVAALQEAIFELEQRTGYDTTKMKALLA